MNVSYADFKKSDLKLWLFKDRHFVFALSLNKVNVYVRIKLCSV